MGDGVSGYFEGHRVVHSARPPDLKRQQYPDELDQIGAEEGLFEVESPPAEGVTFGRAPTSRENEVDTRATKHLWVVAMAGVPAALEYPKEGTVLQRGRLAHTNLTGGENAHTAGELWFYDQNSIVINGGSSRYRSRSSDELMSVAQAFKDAGYRVASMGWDEESGPLRFLRGEPEWME